MLIATWHRHASCDPSLSLYGTAVVAERAVGRLSLVPKPTFAKSTGLFPYPETTMSALVTGTLGAPAAAIYRRAVRLLTEAEVPFLLGGAYALAHHTGIVRHTKDLDLFIRESDVSKACRVLDADGFATELTYPHWLAKAFLGDHFVDLIFNLGNGIGPVRDGWFDRAETGELLGVPVRFLASEEMIYSKIFTMDRGRFDGADVAHLVRARGDRLDWRRLLDLCETHWRILLCHLVLFGFVYPADRGRVPAWVMRDLTDCLNAEETVGPCEPVCRGTLLSPTQFRIDVEEWGYHDARLPPYGSLTSEQIERWTEGVIEGR
jgi:hypothetical protein